MSTGDVTEFTNITKTLSIWLIFVAARKTPIIYIREAVSTDHDRHSGQDEVTNNIPIITAWFD